MAAWVPVALCSSTTPVNIVFSSLSMERDTTRCRLKWPTTWPPTRETIAATLAEVERCTRRGATINIFMLDDDPRLVAFMQEVGRRNGGRVFQPKRGTLGEYVVADYLVNRRGRRRVG